MLSLTAQRLNAAAPDLLAVVESLVMIGENTPGTYLVAAARAALAKATDHRVMPTPTARLLSALLAAWKATENPGHSDLDNEQPISLWVHCTLGDLRALAMIMMRAEHDGGHGDDLDYAAITDKGIDQLAMHGKTPAIQAAARAEQNRRAAKAPRP